MPQTTLKKQFDHYESLQVHHLDILRSDRFPDLVQMTKDRNTVFESLKTALETVVENAGIRHGAESLSILSGYETRLERLKILDQEISDEIQKHRLSLQNNLTHMKKGKAAMNGYKKNGSPLSNPRVLSMNR